jgi:hypothetical protein
MQELVVEIAQVVVAVVPVDKCFLAHQEVMVALVVLVPVVEY